jgi:hypothetical protein
MVAIGIDDAMISAFNCVARQGDSDFLVARLARTGTPSTAFNFPEAAAFGAR